MWIKRQVVMLSTKEKADGVLYLDDTQSGKLFISKAGNRHLYILSDEEIKEDDWVLYTNPNFKRSFIVKISDINHDKFDYKRETLDIREIPISWAKKIIATTDKSLSPRIHKGETVDESYPKEFRNSILPQSSQSFIQKYVEEYNKGNIITEVMVEYERYLDQISFDYEIHVTKLKINLKDNTISVRKIKDSWSREEIIELFIQCNRDLRLLRHEDVCEWIKQNI